MAKDRQNEATEAEAKDEKTVETQTETVSQAQKAIEATEAMAAMENDAQANGEEQQEPKLPKLYIVRRRYTNKSDGKQYWEYILPAVFRGNVSEVHFKASDVIGYQKLEELFDGGKKKVELQFHEEKSYNEKTGLRKYWAYEAVDVDEIGFEWRYPLQTQRGSDKAIMENYIRLLKFEAARSKVNA